MSYLLQTEAEVGDVEFIVVVRYIFRLLSPITIWIHQILHILKDNLVNVILENLHSGRYCGQSLLFLVHFVHLLLHLIYLLLNIRDHLLVF